MKPMFILHKRNIQNNTYIALLINPNTKSKQVLTKTHISPQATKNTLPEKDSQGQYRVTSMTDP